MSPRKPTKDKREATSSSEHAARDRFILHHPTRRQIMEVVRTQPGSVMNHVRLAVNVPNTTLMYLHIERLEDAGLLVRRPAANAKETLLFATEHAALWENPRTRLLFGGPAVRRVALYIADHPGTTAEDLSDAVGINVKTAWAHIAKLVEVDLVGRVRVGHRGEHYPTPELVQWVNSLGHYYKDDRPWRKGASQESKSA